MVQTKGSLYVSRARCQLYFKANKQKNHHTSNNIQLYSLGSHTHLLLLCTWGV